MKASKLHDAYAILRSFSKDRPSQLKLIEPNIVALTESLNLDRVVRQPVPRPDVAASWRMALSSNDFNRLMPNEIRYLFWDKDIALTEEFLKFISDRKTPIRRSALKGLAFVLASHWNEVVSGKIPIKKYKNTLEQLSTSDYLRKIGHLILERDGHFKFAQSFLTEKKTLAEHFTKVFGLVVPSTAYADEVLNVLATSSYSIAISQDKKERHWFYNTVLSQLDKARLVPCLGRIVKAIEQSKSEEPKEELKGFILGHHNLGDPRLPGLESNWDSNDPTTQAIIEWLSQSDIDFFFELFFQDAADIQGRKRFWLSYAHMVRGTRVVISSSDQTRLISKFKRMDGTKVNKDIFGNLLDRNCKATAFIMDFGVLKVVEFSLPNNACYFYESRSKFKFNDRSVFWETKDFRESDLKSKDESIERYSHLPRDAWGPKFANFLARYGIRPKQKR